MLKKKSIYICQSCGYSSPRWMGRCPECDSWNTFVEEFITGKEKRGAVAAKSTNRPVSLAEIPMNDEKRIPTGIGEFDRVLGGGLVPGSVLLIGGAPGMGKSTLLLQAAARLADGGSQVLYISGEESLGQIRMRAERLMIRSEKLTLLSETHVDAITELLADQKPDLVIVDSIQTVFSPDMESVPGNVSQVRYCGHILTSTAKRENIPLLMIGHVNKEGSIAGPRVLEHLIDGLLMLEGDGQHLYRLLRAVKNRFGSTNEVGIFEMTDRGVLEVENPSEHLISQRRETMPGTVVTVSLEGTRPLLVEIQALVSPTSYGVPQRTTTGIDHKRLSILLAVLEKRVGLRFGMQDVFVNAAGGMRISEPAVDLAVAAALVSSLKETPVTTKTAAIGEVGLTGEIRGIPQVEKRIAEAVRLGLKRLILPRINLKDLKKRREIEVIGVDTIRETVNAVTSGK